jgi:3-oxoacyl-[acyl-carrier-protein] synthase II
MSGAAVITGMGAVSPIGVGIPSYVEALGRGQSGVAAIDFTHPSMRSSVAARVGPALFDPACELEPGEVDKLPRLVPMALAAAREAIARAGLAPEERDGPAWLERSRRVGLVLGTGAGGIDFTLDQATAVHTGGRMSLWTITNATHGNLSGELSIRLGLRGPSWCVSTGCASSSDAVGMGLSALRSGSLDAVVCIGADAHVRWETLSGMELLRVISTRRFGETGEDPASASRPFDATRDGFVLGEGAWAVVLERAEAARLRGARSLGEVLGYSATCDAYHRVRPDPDMGECVRAIRGALEDAGLGPEDVELVHYHGTGTKINDAAETRAVKLALGESHARRTVGTSVKSMIGHPQGACGLAALVATLGALNAERPFVPPTINLRTPDPWCDLDYSGLEARTLERRGYVALVNCLAFGAKNAALVVRAGTG